MCWVAAVHGSRAVRPMMRIHQASTTCWLSVCRVMENQWLVVWRAAYGVTSGTTRLRRRRTPLSVLHSLPPTTTTQTSQQARARVQSRTTIKQVTVMLIRTLLYVYILVHFMISLDSDSKEMTGNTESEMGNDLQPISYVKMFS